MRETTEKTRLREKYIMLIYCVHSYLESVRHELIVTDKTTVENFRDEEVNKNHCLRVHKFTLENYNYELSNNQVCNAINLFLEARKQNN